MAELAAASPGAGTMDSQLDSFRALLGDDAVLTEDHELAAFEEGWRYGRGKARFALRPADTRQVSEALRLCDQLGLRVQVVGGNTGMVGASNPDASGEQVVLSMQRLNRRIEIDAVDRRAVVDAGVLLSQLNAAAEPHGLEFPIDLGADPQIGGMVATNTGGTRLIRHGDVRRNVLGMEFVLADGTVVDRMRGLRKDNTGLDLGQLMVGTSGAYGVVTRVVVQLSPRPRQRVVAMAGFDDVEGPLALLARLESECTELLSAFELISREAMEATLRHGSQVRNPLDQVSRFTALVELSTSLAPEVLALDELLGSALEAFAESDAACALDDVAVQCGADAWSIRHQISESLRHEGHVLALDLSVPRSQLPRFSATVRARLAASHPEVRVCDFGHWGDGGVHLNLVWPAGDAERDARWHRELQAWAYELCVRDFGGSYSAEHGVGPHNRDAYELFTDPTTRRLAQGLKELMDPAGRLGTIPL